MKPANTLYRKIELYGALIILFLMLYRLIIGTNLNGILITALVFMAVYYMWFGFFIFTGKSLRDLATPRSRKSLKPFKIASSILMGLVYSFCTIALLYAVFFYEAMNFMLAFAFFLTLLATSFTLVYHLLNPEDAAYLKQFYRRSAICGLLCLILWATPVNTRLNILFRKHPDFIEAYKEYRANPGNEHAKETLRRARSFFR